VTWHGIASVRVPPFHPLIAPTLLQGRTKDILSIHDTRFEKVNYRFFTAVLEFLQTTDADSNGSLSDWVLGSGEDLGRSNVQGLITTVPLVRLVIGII